MPPFEATPEIVVTSAWSLAAHLAERELAPDGGFATLGVTPTRLLEREIANCGLPLLAALVASSPVYKIGDELAPELDASPSPWRDRFLSVEASCRAAISLDVERLLGTEAEIGPLIAAARARGLAPLADLLAERLAGAELDGPGL